MASDPDPTRSAHAHDNDVENRSKVDEDLKCIGLGREAKEATDAEHAMTLRQAIKRYPKAVAWSVFFSAAVCMEGYDIVLIGAFYAYPTFREKYGVPASNGDGYEIPAPWQAGLSNGARVGEILGLLLNGIICDHFGFKKTMIGTLVLLTGLIFIPFFAQNVQTLVAGQVLLGFPWGVVQTITTAYASEVCPVALRAYLTTYVNLNWGMGQMLASGVLRALLSRKDEWSYRIPFALQWMWPVPLISGLIFVPESPWWLVRHGRNEDARRSLRRLNSTQSDIELDDTISMLRHTNEMEKEVSIGTSYLDCFRGANLRRTEITCITWVIQAASGASLTGYAAYFFQQAGLPTSISFDFSISLYAVAMIGVVISWFAMTYVGRRKIYLFGLTAQFTVLMIIGFASFAGTRDASFAIGSLLLLFTLCYDIAVGTVAYSIVAEMPATRLRTKTIVLARSLYNVQGIINSTITPYMLNSEAWNWKAKAGFFWAGTSFLCLVWSYFRLPGAKGRTYGELDALFEQGVSARRFAKAEVDLFKEQRDAVELTAVPKQE